MSGYRKFNNKNRGRGSFGRNRNTGSDRGPRRSGRGPSKNSGKSVSYSNFIRPAVAKSEATELFIPNHSFQEFDLNDLLKANLQKIGFINPTQIQDMTIPLGLAGKDVIGIANTGTGKTAAFGLPILNKLMADKNQKALIVAPTRELAEQIEQELKSFGRGSGIYGALLIGGQSMGAQLSQMSFDPAVVVGTPGRILDHIKRGTLKLSAFDSIVLDEVDRMCDMGFLPDIKLILSKMASPRQSLFFSATITKQIEDLITSFMNQPEIIKIKSSKTSDNVDQNIVKFKSSDHKVEMLHDILIKQEVEKTIIFSKTKIGTEKLSVELESRGFKVASIHGDKNQSARKKALSGFKDSKVQILVATDVAARGIDVADITHVINYDLPENFDDYTHRIGRAGRAGKPGFALTFVPH